MKGIKFQVSGRVQGVFFRVSAKREAERLGLVGWVKNLPSGDVEGEALGSEASLREYCDWLWEGPPSARVDKVQVADLGDAAFDDFEIR